MTSYGRKARVSVWLEQGAYSKHERNKIGLRDITGAVRMGKGLTRNIVRDLPYPRRSQHSLGPAPLRSCRIGLSKLVPFPYGVLPLPRPRDRVDRCAPHSRLLCGLVKPLPSPETHTLEPKPPNAASTSPSSRHLSRFLVAGLLPRPRGKPGRRFLVPGSTGQQRRAENCPECTARAPVRTRGPLGNVVRQTFESVGGRVVHRSDFHQKVFSLRAQPSQNMLVFLACS